MPEIPVAAADAIGVFSDDAVRLLGAIPADGGTISNPALRALLGWSAEERSKDYYAARNELQDAGRIILGRGRGGTVSRVQATEVLPPADVPLTPADTIDAVAVAQIEAVRGELDLYRPMRDVIEGDGAREHRSEPLAVEITALQGARQTGGIWSRPDIVSVEVRAFSYVPGKHIELTTFEVKPSSAITVQAVYEALAHRRSATRSYVLLHVPAGRETELEPAVIEVAEVARSHGIGVITANDPGVFDTWSEREVAERFEPDPVRLNAFIATQLSERAREKISLRLR